MYNTFLQLIPEFPNSNDPDIEGFRKYFGKKEKMFVTNIFSFFHNIFNPFRDRNNHFNQIPFNLCIILTISTSANALNFY